MKILLVITKAEIGGAQSFVLALSKGLIARGDEVAIAFGEGEFLEKKALEAGIAVFKLVNLKRSDNPIRTMSFIRELKRLIDREEFDIVHLNSSNTLAGVLAAKLSRSKPKTVFTVHGLSVLDANYQAGFFVKSAYHLLFSFFLRMIDSVIFVSQHNCQEAKRIGIVKGGHLIYNGIDVPMGHFLSKEEARGLLSEKAGKDLSQSWLIGSVGRLAYPKNYELLIRLFPQIKLIIPEAKGVIIGEGPERQKYEKIIKENDLADDFFLVGEIEEAGRLVQALDVFVLPSLYEGLSISLIEAASAGVCCVASDVGGNREVIGQSNCFSLADASQIVSKVISSKKQKVDVTIFSSAKMVEEYVKVYNQLSH